MMSFLLSITEQRGGILNTSGLSRQPLSNHSLQATKLYMTKRRHYTEAWVIVKMVYPVLIRVKAHTRFRLGRIEKVRSHYRRYWGV